MPGAGRTLGSRSSPAEKLFARVAVPPAAKLFPTFPGVLLPPMTPNMPAGDPRPDLGCDPPPGPDDGTGNLSPVAGCDVARDLHV